MDVTVQLKNCTGTNHCRDNKNIIKTSEGNNVSTASKAKEGQWTPEFLD